MAQKLKKTTCVELAKSIKIDGDIDAAWKKIYLYFVAENKKGVNSILSELEKLVDKKTKKTILELKKLFESNNRFATVLMQRRISIVVSDEFELYLETSLNAIEDSAEVMNGVKTYWQNKEKEFKGRYKTINDRQDSTLFISFVSANPKGLLEAIKIIKGKK